MMTTHTPSRSRRSQVQAGLGADTHALTLRLAVARAFARAVPVPYAESCRLKVVRAARRAASVPLALPCQCQCADSLRY